MTSPESAQAIESIIGYKFRSRHNDVLKALTAAGAVEEDWDGNRKLAQLGTALSEFLLNYLAFEAGVTRAYANDFKTRVTSNEHRASIARRTGISDHIIFNEHEGAQSPSVLAKAVNAVIAVVFFDCGEEIGVVLKTMRHLGIFTLDGQPVDPTILSLDKLPKSLDVSTLAQSLFNVDTGSYFSTLLTCSPARQHETSDFQRAPAQTDVLIEVENVDQLSPTQHDHSSGAGETYVELAVDQSPNESIQIVSSTADDGIEASRCDTIGVVRQPRRPTEKRVSRHRTESRPRKKLRGCDTLLHVDVLERYLTEEERKCQAFGHRTPQDTFLTPAIQHEIHNLRKGKTEVLAKILIHIGSPCLIGGLQDILESCKTQKSCMALETTSSLSRAERVHLIASLGHTMSRSQLLRRYHILELFKDCGGPGTSTCGVIMTLSDFARPSSKRGNPLNRSVADVTGRMMQETFPNIEINTGEYRTKYRWISDIRRLGQRLHMLEARFGQGVLGLILDQGLAGTDVGITDKMIMTPADVEYAKFVDILDKSQGDLLRGLGRAVSPAVQALTLKGLHEHRLFDIEKITMGDIAKYPKGSSAFLELIREVP